MGTRKNNEVIKIGEGEMIQGEYGFNNDILINCMVSNEEKHSVIQHEDTHKRTITGSTLGDLIMMLEKSNVVDNSKNWLLVYFVKSIKKCKSRWQLMLKC